MALTWFSAAPMPIRQSVSPIDAVVGSPSPFTGASEVMNRYHQWLARCHWNSMSIEGFLALKSFMLRCRGGSRLLQIPILEARKERGSKNGNVTFGGGHVVGATSWTVAGGTGTFAAGDWVMVTKIANTPRAYMVTSSESGGVIEVWPGLREATTGSDRIFHMGDVPEIYDTMVLATPEPIFGDVEIQPVPRYSHPFELEFVTALRRNP